MKKIQTLISSVFIIATCCAFTSGQPDQQQLQMASEGCQKPIGILPTPSKLMCLLTAYGKSHNEVKPKALALVFTVCRGQPLQPQPAGVTVKKYDTLGACLQDPAARTLINTELKAQGLPEMNVVNTNVLLPTPTPTTPAPVKNVNT